MSLLSFVRQRDARSRVVYCFFFVFCLASALPAQATDPLLPGRVEGLIRKLESGSRLKGSKLSVAVADVSSGKEIVSHRSTEQIIPASVLKIVSSLAALKFLGSEHRFPTEIFLDKLPSQASKTLNTSAGLVSKSGDALKGQGGALVGNLYVRGYGDPSLLQEHLWEIAQGVRRRGVAAIEHIVIDDSLFVDPPAASGPRPYQAALSAVSLNNNCYQVLVAPSGSGGPAFVSSTPGLNARLKNSVKSRTGTRSSISVVQSPLSSTFSPSLRGAVQAGLHQFPEDGLSLTVKGYIGANAKPVERYQSVRNPPQYFGSVLEHFLKLAGVEVRGGLRQGETPASAQMLFAHESKPLSSILRDLNHYSSNFLAGQILYALGQDSVGYFRQDIGLKRMAKVLEDLGYQSEEFQIADASGLSRQSRLTTGQIVKVLVAAYNDFSIAPDFIASLSRFARTGTLKKRTLLERLPAPASGTQSYLERMQRAESVWGKTGTLNGVSSLAGFLKTRTGDHLAYAVVTNGGLSKKDAIKIENDIVESLIEVN